ncbi:hypothetical protein CS022_20265 [Veronia nyctiphanis]|uniref:Uncharacterized protein n=1 Tax=Veronia nyctiphanis TaxID=1278244 RepID=A0A4Q0YMS5_9GAMM|nr:MotA/TolQ/ExbB proton channel family protein [Veronia nyctiphanis]RXJ71675.1 hypothetical protein CS022_20265 [Veronia nyctiphanis]
MTNSIAAFIASFSAISISNAFISLIALLLVLSTIFVVTDKANNFTSNTANLLTSLGILGTFAGIVVGLMEFDPSNIDGSIESLLAGLKTAFLTSLVGMAASIIFKGLLSFIPSKSGEDSQSIGPEHILGVMSEHLSVSKTLLNSIQGDEDTSLTSQIKKLRMDVNDAAKDQKQFNEKNAVKAENFEATLWNKMGEFGDLLSKSATEQVINALKEVIVEFNDKLTEQFGENFKRLDESVKRLVDWQENYRHQLEEMGKKYQLGVDAISSTEKSVASINERAESIPATMEKLHHVMELGHGQVAELEHRLEAFKDLRDRAVEAMPQIRDQMDSTMSVIGESVQMASTHYESMLAESQRVIDKFSTTASDSVETMRTSIEDGASTVSSELKSCASEIGRKLSQASNDITDNVSAASGALQNSATSLNNSSEQMSKQLNDTINALSSEMRVMVADIKDDAKQTGVVLKEANDELLKSTREIQSETTTAISKLHDRLETTLEEVFQIQAKAVRQTFDSLEDQVTKSVSKTGSAVEKQVEVLDRQMQQEINRTIKEMGEALATVTQQFTRDYQKLVTEMSNVVNNRLAV